MGRHTGNQRILLREVEPERLKVDQQKQETSTTSLFAPMKKTPPIDAKHALGRRVMHHTKLKTDPFLQQAGFKKSSSSSHSTDSTPSPVLLRPVMKKQKTDPDTSAATGSDTSSMGLVNYPDSESD